MRAIWKYFRLLFDNFTKHEITREAATIAFYTIFSLAPTLVIGVFVLGMILGEANAKEEIIKQVNDLIGSQGAETIKTVLENAGNISKGLVASGVSLLVLLYGASKVFSEIRYAFNKILGVERRGRKKVFSIIRGRLLGFALVLILGFFMLVSLVISALLSGFSDWLMDFFPKGIPVLHGTNVFFSLLMITLIFGVLFKFLPERRLAWKYIWPGAFISAVIFSVMKDLFGAYIGNSMVSSAYGAAGSAIVFLVWVYFTALLLLIGAEISNAFFTFKQKD